MEATRTLRMHKSAGRHVCMRPPGRSFDRESRESDGGKADPSERITPYRMPLSSTEYTSVDVETGKRGFNPWTVARIPILYIA